MIVRALSIRQPWAWLIVNGGKDIENRSWNTMHRGLVLIHASKGMKLREYNEALAFADDAAGAARPRAPSFDMLERGGIIGAARLTSVHVPDEIGSPWHVPGCFGFRLEQVAPLPFRPYSGALGLFRVELTPAEVDALRAARLAA
jgi:hypothetical protein